MVQWLLEIFFTIFLRIFIKLNPFIHFEDRACSACWFVSCSPRYSFPVSLGFYLISLGPASNLFTFIHHWKFFSTSCTSLTVCNSSIRKTSHKSCTFIWSTVRCEKQRAIMLLDNFHETFHRFTFCFTKVATKPPYMVTRDMLGKTTKGCST